MPTMVGSEWAKKCFFSGTKWRPNNISGSQMSVRPQKVSSISMKFGMYVSGWRVMHEGMLYDPIRGHGQGHEPMKVRNSAIFKASRAISSPIYNGGWQMTTDC